MGTIKDVAEMSGYSIATVSRYMNQSGYVSKKAGDQIEMAAKFLKYVPMLGAQSIRTNRTKIIALIILTLKNSFFVELASQVDQYCLSKGYTMILCNIDENEEQEKSYINIIEKLRVDGAIFATGTQLHSQITKIPIVLLDRFDENAMNVSMIGSNNFEGGKKATEHLIESGCKSLLYVGSTERSKPSDERQNSFEDVSRLNNVQFDVLVNGGKENYEKVDFSLYDGIFVWNDEDAIDLMFFLLRSGYRVPEDIKIIGYDNNLLSSRVYPSLTTIDQSSAELAKVAVEQIISNIENGNLKDNRSEGIKFETKVIVRESTGG